MMRAAAGSGGRSREAGDANANRRACERASAVDARTVRARGARRAPCAAVAVRTQLRMSA
ncbi:hypothetical protein C7270_11290 [Burkholderia thailandensis]|nr:hypothetical protein [Burkholderia thailandensis]